MAYPDPSVYVPELKTRLQNNAVSDEELLTYIQMAYRDVNPALYSQPDFDNQVLDAACQLLYVDGKFPDVTGVTSNGVTTNFVGGGESKFQQRLNGRREAAWMQLTYP